MRLLAPVLIAVTLSAASLVGAGAVGAKARHMAPQAAETILTGQWEYNTRMGIIPLGSDQRCLKPVDIDNFNHGVCLKRYTCDYSTRVVKDGKIALKGAWTDKKGRVAPVTAKGVYTPESFVLHVNGRTVNGLPLVATLEARRISPSCAAG